MKALLITSITVTSLVILVKLIQLSAGKYPRTQKHNAHDDCINLIASICWLLWVSHVFINLPTPTQPKTYTQAEVDAIVTSHQNDK